MQERRLRVRTVTNKMTKAG